MQQVRLQLEENLRRSRDLVGLVDVLSSKTTPALNLDDILRASVVLSVSALDHFVHEITRVGMLEAMMGHRAKTEAFLRFPISLKCTTHLQKYPSDLSVFDSEIREKHGFLSFQNPDKIADAIRLISSAKLWEEVGKKRGLSSVDAKSQIRLVIARRNQIAHEADLDPAAPGIRWPIDSTIAREAIGVIEDTSAAIFGVVA